MVADRRGCLALVTLIAATLMVPAMSDAASPDGALRVGTSGDYQPFAWRGPTGALQGFDVTVAQRLAPDLGRTVRFVPFQWPKLIAQMRAGAFDIAMSGVTVRPERALYGTYTRPYAVTGAVVVVPVGARQTFHALPDFDRAGVRLAVNRGGHLQQVARRRFPHAQLMPVASNAALPDLLLRGAADAAVSEELEAATWAPGQFVTIGPFTRDRKAYWLPRDATPLLSQVNDWLAARETDGWLNAQRERWFVGRAVVSARQMCFEAVIGAIDLRLQLMPLVAAVKRRAHLAIEDLAQEARVIERVRDAAETAGLNADDVAALFRVQMDAAKAIERQATPGPTATAADVSLSDVRAAVATVTDQIIAELARCQPWLQDPASRELLDRSLRTGLTAPGLPPAVATELLETLTRLGRREPSPGVHGSRWNRNAGPAGMARWSCAANTLRPPSAQ